MKKAYPRKWRFDLVFGLLILAVGVLGVRLYGLMRSLRPNALRLAEKQQRKTTPLPARIGNIYVRTRGRYVLLAGSKEVPLCYIDPALVKEIKEVRRERISEYVRMKGAGAHYIEKG